jgi:4-hydroxy-tetrahydrodipicolinate reductase
VGRALVPAIVSNKDFLLVSAVSRSAKGKKLAEVLGILDLDLVVSDNIDDALRAEVDVLIDYTSPDIVKQNVLAAVNRGVRVVIGTSGLSDSDYEEIDIAARKKNIGVIAAGNFAISSVLMLHFATLAAKFLPSWEIMDYASDSKVDAPSGTAREIANRLSTIKSPSVKVRIDQTKGVKEARGANLDGTQVHSIRLPGYVVAAEVIFAKHDERLKLYYEAGTGPEPYVEGTLLATRKVSEITGLTRGLDSFLGF